MPRVTLNGINTFYQQAGSGVDVILIHALTANLSVWVFSNLFSRLSRDFRVTIYDLRGHGASALSQTGYTSADLADDLNALHGELDLGPALLVGHSFGGVIAVHAALKYPSQVSGVILSDSYFPGLRHLEPEMGQAGPWQELRTAFCRIGIDLGENLDFSRLFQITSQLDAQQQRQLQQVLGPSGFRWIMGTGQLADTTAGTEPFSVAGLTAEKIGSLQQPLVALYDEFSPFKTTCDYLNRSLARCTTDVIPGARHLAPLQCPDVFAEKVHAYLTEMAQQCGL